MAVAYAGFTNKSATLGADLVCDVPTGTTTGNLLVAFSRTTQTMPAPTGWNKVAGTPTTAEIYWRIATGSEPANYTFVTAGTGTNMILMVRFTGNDTGSPIAVAAATSSSGTNPVAPSVTSPGSGVYWFSAMVQNSNVTVTQPSGMTEDFDAVTGGNSFVTAGAHTTTTGSGATGTKTWTSTGTAVNGAFTVLINAPRHGSGSGSWTEGTTATGHTSRHGGATTAFVETGSASGDVPPNSGNGTAAWFSTASPVGHSVHYGGGAGASWSFGSNANGRKVQHGTVSGSWLESGSPSGHRFTHGSTSTAWSFTALASGSMPQINGVYGSFSVAGSSAGHRASEGSASGEWASAPAGAGKAPQRGSAAFSWTFTGTARGPLRNIQVIARMLPGSRARITTSGARGALQSRALTATIK